MSYCPGSLVLAPERRAHRAAGEEHAVGGDMAQHHPLAGAGEDHLVLADHVAAAQAGEADGALGPRAGDAVAAALGGVGEVDPPPRRRRLAEHQRGARGRVDLAAVVHLDDLDVVVGPEHRRHPPGQHRQQVHADAHVARPHDHRVPRRRRQPLEVRRARARWCRSRASAAPAPRARRAPSSPPGAVKSSTAWLRAKTSSGSSSTMTPSGGAAHRLAEVAADPGVARPLGGAAESRAARRLADRPHQHPAHAAGGADHRDPDLVRHRSSPGP